MIPTLLARFLTAQQFDHAPAFTHQRHAAGGGSRGAEGDIRTNDSVATIGPAKCDAVDTAITNAKRQVLWQEIVVFQLACCRWCYSTLSRCSSAPLPSKNVGSSSKRENVAKGLSAEKKRFALSRVCNNRFCVSTIHSLSRTLSLPLSHSRVHRPLTRSPLLSVRLIYDFNPESVSSVNNSWELTHRSYIKRLNNICLIGRIVLSSSLSVRRFHS